MSFLESDQPYVKISTCENIAKQGQNKQVADFGKKFSRIFNDIISLKLLFVYKLSGFVGKYAMTTITDDP